MKGGGDQIESLGMWTYQARAVKAVDGDTIRMTVDLGFRVSHDIDVRLEGVDCPELRRGTAEQRAAGAAARDAAQDWLDTWSTWPRPESESWPLLVTTGKGRSFNRWVGSVRNSADETLSDYLVATGHAVRREP